MIAEKSTGFLNVRKMLSHSYQAFLLADNINMRLEIATTYFFDMLFFFCVCEVKMVQTDEELNQSETFAGKILVSVF